MVIVHGVYHWSPKRIQFRNDYCLSCSAQRVAIRVRTFDVIHIFGIPILPLGFWKRWKCTVCKRDPHHEHGARLWKWFFFFLLIVLAITSWIDQTTSTVVISVLRLIFIAGAAMLLVNLLRTPADPSWKEKIAFIDPATDTICPFCRTPLLGGDAWRCPSCGVVRR
jgi:hypothetical protein